MPAKPAAYPKNILVMKYFGMGSILLATPMLRAIKEQYPEVRLGFITFAANRDMVERLNLIDYVYTLRTTSVFVFLKDLVRSLRDIRVKKYDVAIDMEFFSKFSTIVTYLSRCPVRIGYFLRQLWRGDLLTDHVYYNHYKHITEVFGALAVPLKVVLHDFDPVRPSWTAKEHIAAAALLAAEGVQSNDRLIGINVNVSDLSVERRWPKVEFQRLANSLLLETDVKLVFVGSPADTAYVTEVLSGIPSGVGRIVNLAGKTGLGELLGVIERMDLFVTNDSGPLHIAAALGKPTLSFFGPETPVLYGPKGGNAVTIYNNIYCSPCLNVFNVKTAPCAGQNACISTITSSEVLAKMRNTYPGLLERQID